MAVVQNYKFEGKEFNVWSEDQLGRINRDVLKVRAMDMRDHVGKDRIPPMPHHPEHLRQWILNVQDMMMGRSGSEASSPGGAPQQTKGTSKGGYHQSPSYRESSSGAPPPSKGMGKSSSRPGGYRDQGDRPESASGYGDSSPGGPPPSKGCGKGAGPGAAPPPAGPVDWDTVEAYRQASMGARASQARNRGSNIFG